MALTLTDADVRRLEAAQTALLSVLEHPDPASWAEEVIARTDDLFHSDRTLLLLPHHEGFEMRSSPGMRPFLAPVRRIISGVEPGAIRYGEAHMDQALTARRRAALEVWTNRMVQAIDGRPMEELPFYHEFMAPASVVDGGGISVGLPKGEAMLLTVPGRAGPDAFGNHWTEACRLLVPAFRAAVGLLQESQLQRRSMLDALDAAGRAVSVFSTAGVELHRTPALRRTMDRCGDPDALAREVERSAGAAARLGRPSRKAEGREPEGVGERIARVAGSRYRLRPVAVELGLSGAGPVVLVVVDETRPRLPSVPALRKAHGLTAREAEVALLLARGASNAEAARRLGISSHTVRTHAERIFGKLGIHSRKALALRFLEDAGEEPPTLT